MTRDNSREALLDPNPVTCPIGGRVDCTHFHSDSSDDEADYWCEHPKLGEDEEECPLDEDEDEIEHDDDDMGNQDEEDE